LKALILIERKPTAREFLELRESVGWPLLDVTSLKAGLKASCYGVCAHMDDHVIGTGRVVGDGRTCFYLQDIIVRPEYQRTGIGTAMMKNIMTYIEANACHGAVVGLMSAEGKEAFYERFGFWTRPVKHFGCGMVQFWGENRQRKGRGEQIGPPDAGNSEVKSEKASVIPSPVRPRR